MKMSVLSLLLEYFCEHLLEKMRLGWGGGRGRAWLWSWQKPRSAPQGVVQQVRLSCASADHKAGLTLGGAASPAEGLQQRASPWAGRRGDAFLIPEGVSGCRITESRGVVWERNLWSVRGALCGT